jgi:hypothetical protein
MKHSRKLRRTDNSDRDGVLPRGRLADFIIAEVYLNHSLASDTKAQHSSRSGLPANVT